MSLVACAQMELENANGAWPACCGIEMLNPKKNTNHHQQKFPTQRYGHV